MEPTYWTRLSEGRISRRRGLIATGTISAAAAFLAACGGGSSNSSGGSGDQGKSSLVSKLADTTKQAKRGGTLIGLVNSNYGRKLAAKRMRVDAAKKAPIEHYPAPYALIDLWEAHGGDVTVHNQHGGCRFVVALPAA